jgi:hypothetical protein
MLALPDARLGKNTSTRTLVERVRERIAGLGCDRVWARNAGSHVLLGVGNEEAFARLTPLGGASYGLAFREASSGATPVSDVLINWEMLLVDTLPDVVEHALVAIDALELPPAADA